MRDSPYGAGEREPDAPARQYGRGQCVSCGLALSVYNPYRYCAACRDLAATDPNVRGQWPWEKQLRDPISPSSGATADAKEGEV